MLLIAGVKTGVMSEVEVTVTVEEGVAAGMAEGEGCETSQPPWSGRVGGGSRREESEERADVICICFFRISMTLAKTS